MKDTWMYPEAAPGQELESIACVIVKPGQNEYTIIETDDGNDGRLQMYCCKPHARQHRIPAHAACNS